MRRIGVFICHCGLNIASTVDVEAVAAGVRTHPNVAHAQTYQYLCSEPGQELIAKAVAAQKLDGFVIAACSPAMHETTFRRLGAASGVNPFQVEVANIREQCSWVHQGEPAVATQKAMQTALSMVEKVKGNEPLADISVPVTRRALVVGAGIAGMQAALEIAESGYEVVLVERNPYIGGHMTQLSETFPTLDCAQCILTPKTAEAGRHPRIKLLTSSEVVGVDGYVGNFRVKVRRNPTYVDWAKCTGCGVCQEKCPRRVTSVFDRGLGKTRAISIAFPQAVPHKPSINPAECLFMKNGRCKVCVDHCPVGAIDFEQKEEIVEEMAGAIVVATGYDLFDKSRVAEYGAGAILDVIDGLQFERLNSASGPTSGVIRRPSDGRIPKEVVFIQCVGSRDQEKGYPYCSKICCMYTAKQARLFKHKVHDGQAYLFYMDIRAGGKAYEEFVQKGVEEEGLLYLRGRVARVFQDGDKVMVWGADTLSGQKIEIAADLVVLATAMTPDAGAKTLAQVLKIGTDAYGFFSEAHPKLRPVESLTRGIYLTGACQAPRDIPETVAQAGSAAAKVMALFAGDTLSHPPTVAAVEGELCAGCAQCVPACAYDARELDSRRKVAVVKEVLCQGCGACAVACPNGATSLKNATRAQVMAMVDALT
jgi:heterodisulfide reductase subunit A